jgi:hypothetical protein
MSTLLSTIDIEKLKVRWLEPYTSAPLNKTFPAIGNGILQGFWPVPGGGLVLDLTTGLQGLSMAMVYDSADALSVLYREVAEVALDLAPFAEERVYIGITVTYNVLSATSGEIRAYTEAEFEGGLTDVAIVCAVDVPLVAITASNIAIGCRSFSWSNNLKDAVVQRDDRWVNAVDQADGLLGTMLRPIVVGGSTIDVYTSVQTGSAGAKVATFEHQGGGAVSDQRAIAMVNVAAGEPLFLKLRRNLDGVTATTAGLRITWLTAAGAVVSNQWWEPTGASLAAVTEGWTEYRGSLVAPATTTNALVSLGMQGFSAGTAHFEELFVSANGNDRRGRGVSNLAALGLSVVYQSPSSAVLNEAHMGWTAGAKFEVTSPTFLIRAEASNQLDVGMVSGDLTYYQTEDTHQFGGGNVLIADDLLVSGAMTGTDLTLTGELEVQGSAVFTQTNADVTYPGTVKEMDLDNVELTDGVNAYQVINWYLPSAFLTPAPDTASNVTIDGGKWAIAGAGDSAGFDAPIVAPLGRSIVTVTVYYSIAEAGGAVTLTIREIDLATGVATTLATGTLTGVTGQQTVTATPASPHPMATGKGYLISLTALNGSSGSFVMNGLSVGTRAASLFQAL